MSQLPFGLVETFVASGTLAAEDVEPVEVLSPRFGEDDPERLLGLACAAGAPSLGHVGVRLDAIQRTFAERPVEDDEERKPPPWPSDPERWGASVEASPMVGRSTADRKPFVRVASRRGVLLMTHRLAREEERLAELLRARAAAAVEPPAALEASIASLFDDPRSEAACAVRLAAGRRLTLVTGGPGTGKTFSVKRLLSALLIDRADLVIRLAAPTGKAAARMEEALSEADGLVLPAPVRSVLERLKGETIHRLIGLGREGPAWHDRARPIRADVVVVDEVSMADLPLMRRLVEAVPAHARLILLGDPDQLPSVDAGCVLADLVESTRLASTRAAFSRTFRFDHVPEIKRAAGALKSQAGAPGDDEARVGEALDVLTGGAGAVEWLQTAADWGGHLDAASLAALARPYREHYRPTLQRLPAEPDDAALRGVLAAFDAYRVLTLLRRGPAGVETLNEALATQLGFSPTGKPEHGRPVLVTENSYDLDLFNGDVGIVLSIAGTLKAVFPMGRAGVRAVAVERLPRHEPAFAMTVHKAQGSQFGRVALVMSGRPTPVATREVVYTGLTRAKDSFLWVGTKGELRAALGRRLVRWSALADRLDAEV